MNDARTHYDAFLAPIYVWMVGDVDKALDESRAVLKRAGIRRGTGRAVDLGCGFGLRSIPLAELGYEVTALDQSRVMLGALEARRGKLPITCVEGSLASFGAHAPTDVDVVVCMGDSLLHVTTWAEVEAVVAGCSRVLVAGGRVLLQFRDLVSEERAEGARFSLVRGDESRILTTFLDYTPTTVLVHDIVHTRSGDGWTLDVSVFPKLRVDRALLAHTFSEAGFTIETNDVHEGVVTLVARKA